ncbi:Serine hydroxymethyltransferase, partial [Dissostichus eleginoides]
EIGGGGNEGREESLSSLFPPIRSSISPCISTGKLQTEYFDVCTPALPPAGSKFSEAQQMACKLCQVERLQRLRRGGEVGKMLEGTLWVERNKRMEGLTMQLPHAVCVSECVRDV